MEVKNISPMGSCCDMALTHLWIKLRSSSKYIYDWDGLEVAALCQCMCQKFVEKKSWVRKRRCRKFRSWLSMIKLASHGATTDSGTGGQKLVWQTADEKMFLRRR